MHYQIRKGWPAEAAIDEIFPLEAGADLSVFEGKVLKLAEAGTAAVAESVAAGDVYGFCFAVEGIKKLATVLMSDAVIEVDTELFEAGTYAVGAPVCVKNGIFAAVAADEYAVARVIKNDSINGKLRLMWFSVK